MAFLAETSRREFVRPRLVTVIRNGMKPRKASRFLLNKKTARSYDQVLTDMTAAIKPDWGAIRRVYMFNSHKEVLGCIIGIRIRNVLVCNWTKITNSFYLQVTCLEDFFGSEDIFLASPNDRVCSEDFDLDFEG